MSARTGDPVKTVVPNYHGNDNNRNSGGANRHQSSVGDIPGLASCQSGRQGRAIVANPVSTRAGYRSVFSIRYSYRYKLIDIRYIISYMR